MVVKTPDSPGAVLHSAEHVVEGEIVTDSVLPAVRIVAVEGEGGGKPGVDLVEVHLPAWSLGQRLHQHFEVQAEQDLMFLPV